MSHISIIFFEQVHAQYVNSSYAKSCQHHRQLFFRLYPTSLLLIDNPISSLFSSTAFQIPCLPSNRFCVPKYLTAHVPVLSIRWNSAPAPLSKKSAGSCTVGTLSHVGVHYSMAQVSDFSKLILEAALSVK